MEATGSKACHTTDGARATAHVETLMIHNKDYGRLHEHQTLTAMNTTKKTSTAWRASDCDDGGGKGRQVIERNKVRGRERG